MTIYYFEYSNQNISNISNQNCDSGMARDKIMVIGVSYKQCIFMLSVWKNKIYS